MPRDRRLDFLRGACLMVMTINHLPDMPIQRLTFETFGFITAAEGFFFIAGISCGMAFGRNLKEAATRIYARLLTIYNVYAALTVATWGIAYLRPGIIVGGLAPAGAWWSLPLALTGWPHWSIGFAGILSYYLIFLLSAPFLLKAFANHKHKVILGAATGLWALAQLGVRSGAGFNLIAWQILFVIGMWLGYRRYSVSAQEFPRFLSSRLIAPISAAVWAILFALKHQGIVAPGSSRVLFHESWVVSRPDLGFLRLLDFAAFAALIERAPLEAYERLLNSPVGRLAGYLGRHSLPVFTVHVLVVLMGSFFRDSWMAAGLGIQLVLTCGALLTLLLGARLHELYSESRECSGDRAAPRLRRPVLSSPSPRSILRIRRRFFVAALK
jgi:hypothetical protein